MRRGAGSQRIVAARPLCRLQCPVAYLSRLQRIQPAARWEGSFEAACRVRFGRTGLANGTGPWGRKRPYRGSGRAAGAGAAC